MGEKKRCRELGLWEGKEKDLSRPQPGTGSCFSWPQIKGGGQHTRSKWEGKSQQSSQGQLLLDLEDRKEVDRGGALEKNSSLDCSILEEKDSD